MRIAAVIQARVSSRRLPGKVLRELPYGSGITVLEQVIRRLKKCKRLNDIVVATTTCKEDGEIVAIAEKEQAKLFNKFYRGSKTDKDQSEGTGLGLFICMYGQHPQSRKIMDFVV